jgi:4-amino-4-deoxy-L-arabinose transferase-like glycosyltransferase
MGSWFFFILSVYLSIIWFDKRKDWLLYLNGALSGFGFLVKENGGLGILFLFSLLLISREFKIKEIIFKISKFLIPFLIIIGINQSIAYKIFNFTYIDWYLGNKETYLKDTYSLWNLFKNFSIVFGLGWIFFVLGLFKVFKQKNIFFLEFINSFIIFFYMAIYSC